MRVIMYKDRSVNNKLDFETDKQAYRSLIKQYDAVRKELLERIIEHNRKNKELKKKEVVATNLRKNAEKRLLKLQNRKSGRTPKKTDPF